MKILLAEDIKKISGLLTQKAIGLNDEDVELLTNKAPFLVQKVKTNLLDNNQKPFEGLTDEDKRLLLAFVVYRRQNIATSIGDNPNDEDAAMILHKDVYKPNKKESEKKVMKRLEQDLKKQLSKAGLPID